MTHATDAPPTLLVLAAGMGSRFGGPKQLQPVGPAGATLMDYAVFDAARCGFGKVVFIIRPDHAATFAAEVLPRFAGRIAVDTALQTPDVPPGFAALPGRTKPWGTAHAVLCAAAAVREPFAVVNADDFYGREAYQAVAAFLRAAPQAGSPTYALAGFPLARTVSAAGSVNRAVCGVSPEGWLTSVTEVLDIAADPAGGFHGTDHGVARLYVGSEPVSMNLWAFTPDIFPQLEEGFRAFLADPDGLERREYLIPTLVQGLVARGAARVRVLPTDSPWTGITHPADRAVVEARLAALVAAGVYPADLRAGAGH
jgi:UTP-glucose-1-phosphate uridylyltransferase